MKRVTSAVEFIDNHPKWKEALTVLRKVLLDTELLESIKWGGPVYTLNGKNVVGLGAFKSYVGLWFFQGFFLKDSDRVLINAQEGTTKGMRQLRFVSHEEIDLSLVRRYVKEAIENQRAGKEVKSYRSKSFDMPDELNEALNSDSGLFASYKGLTYGRQKEYAEYISAAKQEKTRLSRLEKIKPMILSNIGLNDRYRS